MMEQHPSTADRPLAWLTARPIAHRGLHDPLQGITENTRSAFAAAMAKAYSIECDVQISADGEAMVFHDESLERLTVQTGHVADFSARQLQNTCFRATDDKMQRFDELLDQVAGRVPLIVELKSLWNDDTRIAERCAALAKSYDGPICFMSFDPGLVEALRHLAPWAVRGIVADRVKDSDYDRLSMEQRQDLRTLAHITRTQPHFISYDWRGLPFDPVSQARQAGLPVITWTIRSPEQARQALHHCDQITFEGFQP